MSEIEVSEIQQTLRAAGIDGWLLYDFHGQNPVARRVVRFPPDRFATRRWFYFIPAKGEPKAVVHAIESHHLDYAPGTKLIYAGFRAMRETLEEATRGATSVAMEYSPDCNIPYVSRVDAGTVELLRGLGKTVVSSANLVSLFESRLSLAQLQNHLRAAEATIAAKDRAFAEIRRAVVAGEPVDEYGIQSYIMKDFARLGLTTDAPPIVAVNAHSGDPHYAPAATGSTPIRKGDVVLIDLWAKQDVPDGIYADFTWVGFVGDTVPEPVEKIWAVVSGARDAAIRLVEDRFERKETVRGYEVDDAARSFVAAHGYADRFFHRTGHNIGVEVHGNGAHMDNFETRDEREVLTRTIFSIEPGVYLSDFGIRSEVDVVIHDDRVEVTGQPIEREVLRILA